MNNIFFPSCFLLNNTTSNKKITLIIRNKVKLQDYFRGKDREGIDRKILGL